jgi:hypothetical protein
MATENRAELCHGRLVTFIADESSWACTECAWTGWTTLLLEPDTGRILAKAPHPYTPLWRVTITR